MRLTLHPALERWSASPYPAMWLRVKSSKKSRDLIPKNKSASFVSLTNWMRNDGWPAKNSQRWRNAWSIRVTPRKRRGSAKRLSAVSTAKGNMPKIRREHLPPGLFNHLLDRISDRQFSASQLEKFADWLDTEPEVPERRGSDSRWHRNQITANRFIERKLLLDSPKP